MATRRTSSSSRSSAGGARRPSSRASSSASGGNQGLFIGIGVVAVIAVVAVFMMGGGGGKSGGEGAGGGAAAAGTPSNGATGGSSAASAPDPVPSSDATLPAAEAKPGKTPTKAAPAITQAALDEANLHYRNAVELWNKGTKARDAGDSTVYTDSLKEAFDEMEALRDALRDQTDWLDEADLEDWAIPADYEGLRRLLGVWDKHYQKVKKLKTR